MTYQAHAAPGGPARVRELPGLIISKLSVGPIDNNAYLLRDTATDQQLLVDAANDPGRLLDLIGPDGLVAVVTTHAHEDHFQALQAVVDRTGCATIASALDAANIPVPTTRPVGDGDVIQLGDSRIEVIQLRGHTPGAIVLFYDDPYGHGHLFTGDSLFPGGVGRTWRPEDFQQLISDVEERVFGRFSDETWVYPGHGDDTTLGRERPHLPEWRLRGW